MYTPTIRGKVYLMGAGPGDPNLLTVNALRVLRAAEVVLHDDLVSSTILDLIPASTQVRNVQKLGLQAGNLQEKIHTLLISAAPEGNLVVRLQAHHPLPSPPADEEPDLPAQAAGEFPVNHVAA